MQFCIPAYFFFTSPRQTSDVMPSPICSAMVSKRRLHQDPH